mgnify:FL=1|tara:strand:- start:396 stop:551 length:156 start_codon:yes stop_codon:yes gene_type:complete
MPASTRNPYDAKEKIIWIYKFFSTSVPEDEKLRDRYKTRDKNIIGLSIKPM